MTLSMLTPTLKVILKLKRTMSPTMAGPMGWREIGKRLGMSPMGPRWHARDVLADPCRCPSCLRKLEKQETIETKTQEKQ